MRLVWGGNKVAWGCKVEGLGADCRMRRRGFHSIKSKGLVDWRAAGPVRNERLLRRECRCRRVGRVSSWEDLDVLGL